jgi:hypothetical protein
VALGEKLLKESSDMAGFKVTKVHIVGGITMYVSFISEIKSVRRSPRRKMWGSGTVVRFPHRIVDAAGMVHLQQLKAVINSYGGLMKKVGW